MNTIAVRIVASADTMAARKEIRALATEARNANRVNRQALAAIAGSNLNTQPISRIRDNMDRLVESTRKGKITFDQLAMGMGKNQKILQRQAALYSAQLVAQNDMMTGMKRGVLVMDDFSNAHTTLRQRIALNNTLLHAFGRTIVDTGKNMQWAGRQITVGFSVPFAIAGAAAAREFMKVEDQLVRFRKVYNDSIDNIPVDTAIDRIKELSRTLIDELGTAQEGTLEVAASFAQMGKGVKEVEELTKETMRLSQLGEIDPAQTQAFMRTLVANKSTLVGSLSDTVNLLNAIENSTSLTTQAMAEALPDIIAQAGQFNIKITEMASLTAVMNETLGSATEATTALRFSMNRILNPTEAFIDSFKEVTGLDWNAFITPFAGPDGSFDLTGFLGGIGQVVEAMQSMPNAAIHTQQLVGDLFGARQTSRMLTAIQGIRDQMEAGLNNPINDFGRGMAASVDSTENLADASAEAQQEIAAQLESTSGRFRQLINQIKADIADIGGIFLEMVIGPLSKIGEIIKSFSNLDESTKRMVIGIGAFISIFGGLIMFTGIAVNAFGMLIRMVTGLGMKLKLTNSDIRAADLAMDMQNMSARELLQSLVGVNTELTELIVNQQAAATAAGHATSALQGQTITLQEYERARLMVRTGMPADFIGPMPSEGPRIRNRTNVKTSPGGGLALMGLASTAMLLGNNGKNSGLMDAALYATIASSLYSVAKIVGPALLKMMTKLGSATGGVLSGIAGWVSKIHGAGGVMAGLKMVGAAIGPAGLIATGVAAIGFGIIKWVQWLDRGAKAVTDVGGAAKEVAAALGQELDNTLKFDLKVDAETGETTEGISPFLIRDLFAGKTATEIKSMILEMALGGTDAETIKQLVEAVETGLEIDLKLNVSDLDLALKEMSTVSADRITDLVNSIETFKTGLSDDILDFLPGNWTRRPMNMTGMAVTDQMAEGIRNQVQLVMSGVQGAGEGLKKILEQDIPKYIEKGGDELQLVSKVLTAMGPEAEKLQGEFKSLSELIGFLADNTPAIAEALPGLTEKRVDLENELAAATEETNKAMRWMIEVTDWYSHNIFSKANDIVSALQYYAMQTGISANELGLLETVLINLKDGADLTKNEIEILQKFIDYANDSFPGLNLNMDEFIDKIPELGGTLGSMVDYLNKVKFTNFLAGQLEGQPKPPPVDPFAKYENAVGSATKSTEGFGGAMKDAGDEAKEITRNMGNLRGAIDDVLDDYVDKIMESFDKQKEAIEETYRLEEEKDKLREDAFKAELERQRRLRAELQGIIDFDAAVARGDLDRAAEIRQEGVFERKEAALAEFQALMEERAKIRDDAKEKELELHDQRVDAMKEELETLSQTTPATAAEWRKRINEIQTIVERYGFKIDAEVQKFGVDGWSKAIDNWAKIVTEDNRWNVIEEGMAALGRKHGEAYVNAIASILKGGGGVGGFAGMWGAGGGGGSGGGGGFDLPGPTSPTATGGASGPLANYMGGWQMPHRDDLTKFYAMLDENSLIDPKNVYLAAQDGRFGIFVPPELISSKPFMEMLKSYLNSVYPGSLATWPINSTAVMPLPFKVSYDSIYFGYQGYTGGGSTTTPFFHQGGFTGWGSAIDMSAVLQRGEYVIQRDAVRQIGVQTLDALNTQGAAALPPPTTGGLTLQIGNFYGTKDNIDELVRRIEQILDRKQGAMGRARSYG